MCLPNDDQSQPFEGCAVSLHPDLRERINEESRRMKSDSTVGADESLRDLMDFMEKNPRRPYVPDPAMDKSMTLQNGQMTSQALATPPPVVRGNVSLHVILANFSDLDLPADINATMKDLFFSTGVMPYGSVKEYYNEVSRNNVSISGRVLGPYRLPRTKEQYANNAYGRGGAAPNVVTMASEAINLARADIRPVKDGINAIMIIHAGSAAEETGDKTDIWSVLARLGSSAVTIDGVTYSAFVTVPGNARIGICCHELGHLVFAWGDMYDQDFSSAGLGDWCLMAGGEWGYGGLSPAHPNPWLKVGAGYSGCYNVFGNGKAYLSRGETLRLWKNSVQTSQYFLAEVRLRKGFDVSIPGPGLLIWRIDETRLGNDDEKNPMIKLMQADGLDSLANSTMRGDSGDPFPGLTWNTGFGYGTNPSSSFDGTDSYISIYDISSAGDSMTFNVTVKPHGFTPVYSEGAPGAGIGGYDLRNKNDRCCAFDFTSSGKLDHLVLYRPGFGTFWIVKRDGASFIPVYGKGMPENGIGGYDLRSARDTIIPYDYNSSGKMDHLLCYRPGGGAWWIMRNDGGKFTPVYTSSNGIGGYNFADPLDQCFAFDYNSTGKLDHLCLYRPGQRAVFILKNDNGNFVQAFKSFDGIGTWDLANTADRAFAFDFDSSGKQDHIFFYRSTPDGGSYLVIKNFGGGNFNRVTNQTGTSPDLKYAEDQAFAMDYRGTGKMDHVCFYRPWLGAYCVLRHDTGANFSYVAREGPMYMPLDTRGAGIGGYDLMGPDSLFAFDYNSSGRRDHVVCYRKDGSGTIWILRRDGSP